MSSVSVFGVRGANFAMSTLLVANSLITISEFAGIAAASELFGIPKYVTVPVAADLHLAPGYNSIIPARSFWS